MGIGDDAGDARAATNPRRRRGLRINPMRRESATVVALVGEVAEGLLAELGRSVNVSVARAPAAGTGQPEGEEPAAARPGWEAGARALREAARRQSAYVIVPEDPLAEVAAAWREMWDVRGGPAAAARFEQCAAEALAAWRAKRFDLPDYYLIMAAAPDDAGPDLYLGPLRAARPRRAVVAGIAGRPGQAARALDTLRSLEHGPWWPPRRPPLLRRRPDRDPARSRLAHRRRPASTPATEPGLSPTETQPDRDPARPRLGHPAA